MTNGLTDSPAPAVPPRQGDGRAFRVWPLRKPALIVLAKGGLLLLVVWSVVGVLFMQLLDDGPVGDADRTIARSLEDSRTPTWDTISHVGSMMSETLVKVLLVAVVGAIMVAVWKRWHDGVFLAVVVGFEATVFVLVSFIVMRERPPVDQLDAPAPSGSFPSGHAAAAVAFYASLFVIARWHTRHRLVRCLLAIVAVAVPVVVAVARTYRGMHHPIDVIAGILLGLASIMVVLAAMRAGVAEIDREAAQRAVPDRARRLDLTEPVESHAEVPR
jgi:membrane-associated phospholipid phosphatase